MRAAYVLFALVPACGFGFADDESGGKDGLPTTGAGPYQRLEADETTPVSEPWLVTNRTQDLTEPAILARDGGGFAFWFTREPADLPAGDTQIWRGATRSMFELPDEEPAPVLVADQAWEEGHVAAPALVALPDRLVMFYEGGLAAPQIGRAESTDGGRTWTKAAAPVLAGGRSPGAAFDGSTWLLAVGAAGGTIELARSTDGQTFGTPEVLLEPTGAERSFERVEVAAPTLAWLVESTGRGHWALWYAGLEDLPDEGDAPRYAVGYAASFDGMAWAKLGGGRPVLGAPAGAPAVLVEGARGTMLYQANDGLRPAVGIARHP